MAQLRRASPTELRSALQRVKRHLALADTSGLEGVLAQGSDVLAQGSDVPADGASVLLMTAHFSDSGAPPRKVPMETVDRIR